MFPDFSMFSVLSDVFVSCFRCQDLFAVFRQDQMFTCFSGFIRVCSLFQEFFLVHRMQEEFLQRSCVQRTTVGTSQVRAFFPENFGDSLQLRRATRKLRKFLVDIF